MTREEIISNLLYMKHAVKADTVEDITINEAIKALEQEPCEDAISRQQVIESIEFFQMNPQHFDFINLIDDIKEIPPVKPQYTDAEIQKMQDLEFAEIQKAYEIGKEEGSSEKPNKWIDAEVLDKIRAEMEQIKEAEYQIYGKGSWRFVDKCLEIIDKYKASPAGEEVEE